MREGMYLVVKCPQCGRLTLSKASYRTRTCPYCGKRILLRKAMIVARTSSSIEATEVIRGLKRRGKTP